MIELFKLSNPEFWVLVGLAIFFTILIVVKVPGMVLGNLDARSAAIQAELDEAKAIREQAQAMLAQLTKERAEAEAQAKDMLDGARAEAERMSAEAAAKLTQSLAIRQRAAEQKIASVEAQAIAEVKAAAADLAAAAAERLMATRLSGMKTDAMIDVAVKDMAGKLQ
jgi:F-type H+-transporting ATPase subunit b